MDPPPQLFIYSCLTGKNLFEGCARQEFVTQPMATPLAAANPDVPNTMPPRDWALRASTVPCHR